MRTGFVPSLVEARDVLGSPSHVAGLVVPVDLDPVKDVSSGTGAYLGQERREVVLPFEAYRDTAASVVGVLPISWILTASLRVLPCFVFRSTTLPVGTVQQAGSSLLPKQAPARDRMTIPQIGARNRRRGSARTLADPRDLPPVASGAFSYDRQPSEHGAYGHE
jgi:hypothetical protein